MADQNGMNERQRELFIRKSTRVAASYLKRAKELSELPDAAKPFFDVLENTYVNNVKEITKLENTSPSDFTHCGTELLHMADIQKPEGMKSIGTLCVMVPAELVYAAGAMPVRLCSGSYTAYSIGDDYIPRDACPLVKAVMGFGKIKALPAFDNCPLLVAPVTCDCKKKLAGTIDSVKDTIPLHIPPLKKDDADTEIFLKELYRLIPLLENVTGKQVTAKSLAEGINMVGNAQYEMSEFLKYRRHDLSLMSGTQVMAVMNAYSYMPVNLWAE